MKRLNTSRIWAVLGSLALGGLAVALMATPAHAAPDRLRLVASSDGGAYALEAYDIPAPGLTAWSVDVTHDGSVVELTACAGQNGSQCGPEFDVDTTRVTGASQTGLSGSAVLATLSFECLQDGEAEVTFTVNTWAHGTAEGDLELDDASIDCTASSMDTSDPQATATPRIGLPDTGAGPAGGGGAPAWVLALLLGAGLAAFAAGARSRLASESAR